MNSINLNNIYEKNSNGNFQFNIPYSYDSGTGLSKQTINYISSVKNESVWLKDFRLKSLEIFYKKKLPIWWAPFCLINLNFKNFRFYLSESSNGKKSWSQVPEAVKKTFDRLGVPEQERKFLAGVEAQFDSEAVYSSLKKKLLKKGVIFLTSKDALIQHPKIFKKYFSKIIPVGDNKFSALNSAVFSGGSFIYIPDNVILEQPLQAYFRINSENFGQFERTLIISGKNSSLIYIEGCTAPTFNSVTLHSAVVELVALENSKIQYITIQNWSNNVFNLVTKRGIAYTNAEIRWIDCNIGSRLTMKYPSVILKGEFSRGEVLSIALASQNQHQDTGSKMIHLANNTTSNIISKSVNIGSGKTTYRGLVKLSSNLKSCKNNTECDALLINKLGRADTYPTIISNGGLGNILQHEARVSKINDLQLFYIMQRNLSKVQATSLLINGFINNLIVEFPVEYSIELKRLIELEMEGSVG